MTKVKNKQNKKSKEESLAFASLIEEVEKSRKRAKIFYISGLVLVILSVFSFLLFGPLTVPIFSELGENILGRSEVARVEEEDVVVEEVPEEVTEQEVEDIREEEEPQEKEQVVEKKVATTPKTQPKPTPEPTYVCTDQEIQEIRDAIKQIEGYKKVSEDEMNQAFFDCFDYGLENYPNETEDFYKDICYEIVCIDNSPMCDLPDQFQEGIDDFQSDLDYCLSDR
jgi:hypothetical protein